MRIPWVWALGSLAVGAGAGYAACKLIPAATANALPAGANTTGVASTTTTQGLFHSRFVPGNTFG